MLASVTLENDHPCGLDPQPDPGAAGRLVASRAAPTAHPNDGPDRPCSDLQGLAYDTLRDPRARSEQMLNWRDHSSPPEEPSSTGRPGVGHGSARSSCRR